MSGLFLVIPALSRYGLRDVMTTPIDTDDNALGAFRAGAGLSNVVD